jgi:nucleoside-diphosphate-sugar epimerase
MRIFLAGATGVIGSRVLPLLIADGHQVTALTRRSASVPALRRAGAEPVVADAFDPADLATAVRQAEPDLVMHQLTDLSAGSLAANSALRVAGTRNLVDAAIAAGVRRIIAQSVCWAYQPGEDPAPESTPLDIAAPEPRRTTIEGIVALEGTAAELPDALILRYGLLYGPGTWFAPDGLRADDARAGKLVADGAVTSFVHVDDAAAAAVQALGWPIGPVNVCDDAPAAAQEWAPAFCAWVGAPSPSAGADRPRWARGATNHYARKHLNWTPRYPSWRDVFRSDGPRGWGAV